MKTTQTDRFFTPLSSTEAETINGGDALSNYLAGISFSTGAFQFLPFFNEVVAFDQFNAFADDGSLGQLNYLLSAANFLSF
jgi:hypothetical protein